MELVIFIGIQATGKSSFYRERFFRSHVRINGDMLKTRRREELLVNACLEGKTPFVVDKMNLTRVDRARYIGPAKAAGLKVTGYFLQSQLAAALERNARRGSSEQVPEGGLRAASAKLELPDRDEGFDELFYVKMDGRGGFIIEDWKNEV
jgi:predicted kinase